MANCQNNMCYSRRPMQSAQTARNVRRQRTDGCPDTHDHFPADMPIAMAYVPWAGYLRTVQRTGKRNYLQRTG